MKAKEEVIKRSHYVSVCSIYLRLLLRVHPSTSPPTPVYFPWSLSPSPAVLPLIRPLSVCLGPWCRSFRPGSLVGVKKKRWNEVKNALPSLVSTHWHKQQPRWRGSLPYLSRRLVSCLLIGSRDSSSLPWRLISSALVGQERYRLICRALIGPRHCWPVSCSLIGRWTQAGVVLYYCMRCFPIQIHRYT